MAKEKEKAKVDSKELVEHTLVKNKHRTLNGGQKKIVLGGPRVRKAGKFLRRVTMAFRTVVFAPTNQKKVHAMNSTCTKAEARIRKEKARKVPILNEGYGHTWESDDWYSSLTDDSSTSAAGWYGTGHSAWMASVPLNTANHPTHVVLDLGCTRSIGSRAANKRFQEHTLYHGITTAFCRCNTSFVVCQLRDRDLLGK